MSLEINKAIARRLFELHDEGDPALVAEIVAGNAVLHMPDPASNIVGPDELASHILETRAAFPDIQHPIDDLIAEGDRVAIRLRVRATHQGEYAGIAPTGRLITLTVMQIVRISQGKVVEGWCDYDALGFMQQLGMVLQPAAQGG